MNQYSNAELTDMHYVYGAVDGNGRAAVRMYRQRFPNRRVPDHRLFGQLHRRLQEAGSFRISSHIGRQRTTRTPNIENSVLDAFTRNPRTSIRVVERDLGVSRSSIMRILREDLQHPYHIQRVQALSDADYPQRVAFARWYLQARITDPQFPSRILFTDEATFSRDGVLNQHNMHLWSVVNPHATRSHNHQYRFSVNIWAGIIGDMLIGPYVMPGRLNGVSYAIFLEEVLPTLLVDVPATTRLNMWFQHDGAPPHFALNVRDFLDLTYPNRWIGRGGPVPWPPRSPDLTPLDFYLWGHLKCMVYETPVPSDMDLMARIVEAAARVRETTGQIERVRDSMRRRCEACIAANGANFEHLL